MQLPCAAVMNGDMRGEQLIDRVSAASGGGSSPQQLGRLSLEEAEEQLAAAEELDEETREDRLLERIAEGCSAMW